MRDPKRIPKILSQLRALWMCSPDLRLGQLILNVARQPTDPVEGYSDRAKSHKFSDIYNIEDEELIRRISTLLKDH